jgi:hypothetical protein
MRQEKKCLPVLKAPAYYALKVMTVKKSFIPLKLGGGQGFELVERHRRTNCQVRYYVHGSLTEGEGSVQH